MPRLPFAWSSIVLFLAAAACGGNGPHGEDICALDPPPEACNIECDPTPGAPQVCPQGYHCGDDMHCTAECTPGGDECGAGYRCTDDGRCIGENVCENLECQQVDCTGMGQGTTSLSGTVYAPNGTLPLYGIDVYVPNADPGALPDGARCSRCTDGLPGQPLVQTRTDEAGHFVLTDVPVGNDIPLIIQSGKWRRQITISNVPQCVDTPVAAADTKLPSTKTEGDIPKIALSTGSADALECLLRKLGIADSEITGDAQGGRVNLYSDTASGGEGADQFQSGFAGGSGNFPDSQTLWGDLDKMKTYDMVIFSCEGGQYPDTKSQEQMDAVKAYADYGGRMFMSHWHNVWIEGGGFEGGAQAPAVWTDLANWNNGSTTFTGTDTIDEQNNPKGPAFATWMLNVGGSPNRGEIPIANDSGKNTCESLNNGPEQWVYWNNGTQFPQNFQFTTPAEAPPDDRCGKVVFSDMHVSGDSTSPPGAPGFPSSCSNADLTPQEKALAFMIFDLASCIVVVP
jgi:hypothetical protein